MLPRMVEATALVLAGGQSRRMGRDKRFLRVEGETLLQRTFDLARAACKEVQVLISQSDEKARILEALEIESPSGVGKPPILTDQSPGSGPLTAVLEAAAQCRTQWVLVLAVDYPALTSGFLQGLLKRAQALDQDEFALVPRCQGQLQYACALYRRQALIGLAQESDPPTSFRSWLSGAEGLVAWTEAEWTRFAPSGALVNWNRPADWNGPGA
ncbi:MAG TPA: molybdenum cofactor guanylyltransferase [Acidobacteriota bacterium]|nr:molybdenum cofactor guanylyltransferase [Acidobacteriota bacterium]